jgi:hypothetical protein
VSFVGSSGELFRAGARHISILLSAFQAWRDAGMTLDPDAAPVAGLSRGLTSLKKVGGGQASGVPVLW